nr:PREDICTED: uncharacterized protein LOC105678235 isoform X4 [Linepithema humile]XP_012232830.1 PREDICTED: uncharacterized protein LOC105678235 isoform X4 [Linepithema humile]
MALDNHWPYFRYTKQQRAEKMQIQCIICGQFLLNNQMENHAKTHSPQELSCKFDDWVFKYAKEEEDFLKCTNCNESMYIIVTINHLKTHMSDKHSEDYDRIRRNEMFWTFQTGKNSWLQKCYRDAGNFRAECTVCKFKEVCFKMEQFQRHLRNPIRKSHYNIFNSEEWKQDQQDHNFSNNWKCLRYTYNTERRQIIECVICHQQNVKIDHCCSQDLKSYSQHWVFKYARQNGSYANCTICEENINLDYDWDNLKNHMSSLHLDKWERIEQEEQKIEQIEQKDLEQGTAHDEAGPSTSYAS